MPVTGTAADAEAIGVEQWAHAWLTLGGAVELRRFLAERLHDEMTGALSARARGERGDVWGETRRLANQVGLLDVDIAARHRAALRVSTHTGGAG